MGVPAKIFHPFAASWLLKINTFEVTGSRKMDFVVRRELFIFSTFFY